jgi:DNA ligase-1
VLLADVVATSQRVRSTRSRKAKTSALAELLAAMDSVETGIGVAYLAGELPQGRIGLGYAAVHAVNVPPAADPSLTLRHVDTVVTKIASISGAGSKAARHETLTDLLARATEPEQAFLRRLILRELRQGALEGVMVEAIAIASKVPAAEVRRAAMVGGELPAVAVAAREGGAAALAGFRLTLFRPVQPMLAQPAADVADALTKVSPAAAEYKLDGARIQVHRNDDRVAVYTRNLRDVTAAVPEVVAAVRGLPLESVILDGEAIALRPDGRPHPFQVTMSRFGSRDGSDAGVVLSPFFFDCLHLDGIDLIDEPADLRTEQMAQRLPPNLMPPRRIVTTDEEATAFFDEGLLAGHEGMMIKSLDAPYAAGRRGAAWLKVKPAHTLDLVVLAVEWGSGRRRGLLSNLHLGARDANTGEFVMLGKTFKGLTDETLKWQTERFLGLETRREGHVVYVKPEQVVEVAFDGIQASSRYAGGMALRFARVKGYREDKTAEAADTVDTVRAIFQHSTG